MLKLPKDLKDNPKADALSQRLAETACPLRQGGKVVASKWSFDDRLGAELKTILRWGHLEQGLEQIATALDREAKGLKALQAKTGSPQGARLSRLLIMSKDGSERFYHDAESILQRNSQRAWGLLLDTSAETLGAFGTTKGGAAKALLINDREALAAFLTSLCASL